MRESVARADWEDEIQLAKIMPNNIRYPRATLNPQRYPSPEPSPDLHTENATNGEDVDQTPWKLIAGGPNLDGGDGEEASWQSEEDDSSGPTLSKTSPQPLASRVDSVKGVGNLPNHGEMTTPPVPRAEVNENVLKLSPAMIHELTSSPESLPSHVHSTTIFSRQVSEQALEHDVNLLPSEISGQELRNNAVDKAQQKNRSGSTTAFSPFSPADGEAVLSQRNSSSTRGAENSIRPHEFSHTVPTPPLRRSKSSKIGSTQPPPPAGSKYPRATPTPLQLRELKLESKASTFDGSLPSPMPQSIPLPPLSLPTYLQLELSSHRPSPLYIHRSATSDFPYESSRIKIERLQNFLLLPPQLEQVLWFGALACLDSWLFSFTILPLRFFKALYILSKSWGRNIAAEIVFIGNFIYAGAGRMWRRRRRKGSESTLGLLSPSEDGTPTSPLVAGASPKMPLFSFSADMNKESPIAGHSHPEPNHKRSPFQKHRRSKSVPSALLPDHKADILKGLLIIISCTILMYFDASRMYHGIRGQAAIKLYVIYNVLEVSILTFCYRYYQAKHMQGL